MIVLDASTLILIARGELLDKFLDSVTAEVVIPSTVEKECCAAKQSLDALLIQRALGEGRIRVITVRKGSRQLCEKLRADLALGKGEAEAVAVAFSERAGLVAIDDKSGINACKLLRIPFTTAVGILIRMRQKGLLERSEALAKLQVLAKHGRYRAAIIEDARSRLEGT